jgi:phosphopantothenoylcysteine synthetase/decarboxylase
MLKGKKIILGITASIAAYKAATAVRLLRKEGAEVRVVMTPMAREFVTPGTLSTLSENPVLTDFFSGSDGTWNSHVDLGKWADVMVIAPLTACTMGKMVNGIADNLLVATYLSARCPVIVAPAMDLDMFNHPSTKRNLDILRKDGNIIIEPATGELASGLHGKGRMEEPEMIVKIINEIFEGQKSKIPKKRNPVKK